MESIALWWAKRIELKRGIEGETWKIVPIDVSEKMKAFTGMNKVLVFEIGIKKIVLKKANEIGK